MHQHRASPVLPTSVSLWLTRLAVAHQTQRGSPYPLHREALWGDASEKTGISLADRRTLHSILCSLGICPLGTSHSHLGHTRSWALPPLLKQWQLNYMPLLKSHAFKKLNEDSESNEDTRAAAADPVLHAAAPAQPTATAQECASIQPLSPCSSTCHIWRLKPH